MAAPVLRAAAVAVLSDGATITSPSATAVGDLMVFAVWSQGANQATLTHNLQSGFFEWRTHAHDDGTTDGRLSVAVKEATSAGANAYTPYTISNATANQTSISCYVIEAGTWLDTLDTETTGLGQNSDSGTNNAAPNCPSVTGLTGDFLVLAIAAWHVTSAAATQGTAGANYVIRSQNANSSHVTHLAIKDRTLTALSNATEDPPAYTDNVTPNGTARMTLAIPGAAAAGQESTPAAGAAASGAANPTLTLGGVERTVSAGTSASAANPTITLGGVTRTPSPAVASAGATDPGWTTNQTATPAPAVAGSGATNPTQGLGGVTRTPAPGVVVSGGAAPTLGLGGVGRTPLAAAALGLATDPELQLGGVSRTAGTAVAVTSAANPTATQGTNRTPGPAVASTSGAAPVVSLGGVSRTPVAAVAASGASAPGLLLGGVSRVPVPAVAASSAVDLVAGAGGEADPPVVVMDLAGAGVLALNLAATALTLELVGTGPVTVEASSAA